MTLYVNLREGEWQCVRCKAGGDAMAFRHLADAVGTKKDKREALGDPWQQAMKEVSERVAKEKKPIDRT